MTPALICGRGDPPQILALELTPIIALIGLLVVLTVKADVTLRYMQDTADVMMQQSVYADGVLGAPRAEDAESSE